MIAYIESNEDLLERIITLEQKMEEKPLGRTRGLQGCHWGCRALRYRQLATEQLMRKLLSPAMQLLDRRNPVLAASCFVPLMRSDHSPCESLVGGPST